MNGSVALIGGSGSGKTVEEQRLSAAVARQGGTVLVISTHGSFADDQILPYYSDLFQKYRHDVYANREGIPIPLFESVTYPDGERESEIDTAGAVTNIFSSAFRFGIKQRVALRAAVEEVMASGGYRKNGLRALGHALRCEGDKKLSEVYERMRSLFEHNVFVHGDVFLQPGKINILHLEKCDVDFQAILTEILLSYVWRMANAEQYKYSSIYLVLDECQNAHSGGKDPLAMLISEGRKMGVNLILATQLVLQGSASAVQQRITQCGLMLFFKPAANRLAQTARMITPGNESKWVIKLRNLKKGEFVAVGNFLVGEEAIDYPLIVSANTDVIGEYDELVSDSDI